MILPFLLCLWFCPESKFATHLESHHPPFARDLSYQILARGLSFCPVNVQLLPIGTTRTPGGLCYKCALFASLLSTAIVGSCALHGPALCVLFGCEDERKRERGCLVRYAKAGSGAGELDARRSTRLRSGKSSLPNLSLSRNTHHVIQLSLIN